MNHVWGSAVAVATNMHLIAALPDMPGGLFQRQPMLEFDTTHNLFRDELLEEPLALQAQVKANGGYVDIPMKAGIGVEPSRAFINHYKIA